MMWLYEFLTWNFHIRCHFRVYNFGVEIRHCSTHRLVACHVSNCPHMFLTLPILRDYSALQFLIIMCWTQLIWILGIYFSELITFIILIFPKRPSFISLFRMSPFYYDQHYVVSVTITISIAATCMCRLICICCISVYDQYRMCLQTTKICLDTSKNKHIFGCLWAQMNSSACIFMFYQSLLQAFKNVMDKYLGEKLWFPKLIDLMRFLVTQTSLKKLVQTGIAR